MGRSPHVEVRSAFDSGGTHGDPLLVLAQCPSPPNLLPGRRRALTRAASSAAPCLLFKGGCEDTRTVSRRRRALGTAVEPRGWSRGRGGRGALGGQWLGGLGRSCLQCLTRPWPQLRPASDPAAPRCCFCSSLAVTGPVGSHASSNFEIRHASFLQVSVPLLSPPLPRVQLHECRTLDRRHGLARLR